MVFYSATTPDFNLTWVAMQGSTREQILTKEEIRPICHELGSLSFGLAWRAGITNALQTHSMAWHVPVRSETSFSTPACPKVLQRSRQSASMHENWWICSKIHGHNLRCDPKDQLRSQIHSFGSFGGRDFAKRPECLRLSWREITDTSGVSPFCQDAKIMQDWWGRSAPLVAAFVLQETMACLCYDMLHFFCVLFPSCLCRVMSCYVVFILFPLSRFRSIMAAKRTQKMASSCGHGWFMRQFILEDFWRFLVRRKH